VTSHARALVANVVLAPILGLGLLYGHLDMVIARDIGGVPLVAYAFIATLVPVTVLSVIGNRICARLERGGFAAWRWYVVGVCFGAIAGAFAGWVLGGMGVQSGSSRILVAGGITGAVCGLVQVLSRRKGARDGAHPAVA
jgi:hypothetical protein